MRRAAIAFGAIWTFAASPAAVARPPVDTGSAAACSPDSAPPVSLRPDRGPVGTRIRFRGRCFDPREDASGYGVFLIRQFSQPRECELILGGRQRFDVGEDGTARGFLVVAGRGHCTQRSYGRRATPGLYGFGIGSHASRLATFRVTRR